MSRQGNKKESASGMDLLKSVDIVSNHLTWTPEGMDHPILKDITLNLEPGHIYGIIGPNGAGKSSFLRHVLAFLKTESKESMNKEAVYRAFSLTKADKLKDKKFAILSGGEKQKIVIARAVAQTTPWMLLDEPIASLDIKNQIEIMQTLSELNRQEGVSVLMVLHDINLAGIYCDRLIMLKDGQVIAAGNTNECLCEENLKKLYDISFFHMDTKKGQRYYYAEI